MVLEEQAAVLVELVGTTMAEMTGVMTGIQGKRRRVRRVRRLRRKRRKRRKRKRRKKTRPQLLRMEKTIGMRVGIRETRKRRKVRRLNRKRMMSARRMRRRRQLQKRQMCGQILRQVQMRTIPGALARAKTRKRAKRLR